MTLPQVVSQDLARVKAETIAQYESLTGKPLYDAQPEMLLINLMAYRETLALIAINDSARQNLPQFAREPMLELLGTMFGVYRLPPQAARTTLRFSLTVPVATPTLIPKGHRIEALNGALFVTAYELILAAGSTQANITGICDTPGSAANGLQPGQIKEPFDALPDGVKVVNTTITSGGAEVEDLERFRSRILLAMSRPSAGSRKAYRMAALSADSRVIDVSVLVIAPGWVRLAVLTEGDPTEIVAAVDRAVQADDVKPLTDRADVIAAVPVAVPITVQLTPRKNALVASLQAAAEAALKAHKTKLATTLGYDGVPSEISAKLQEIIGVKRVEITGGVSIAPHQYAVLSWTLSFAEAEDD